MNATLPPPPHANGPADDPGAELRRRCRQLHVSEHKIARPGQKKAISATLPADLWNGALCLTREIGHRTETGVNVQSLCSFLVAEAVEGRIILDEAALARFVRARAKRLPWADILAAARPLTETPQAPTAAAAGRTMLADLAEASTETLAALGLGRLPKPEPAAKHKDRLYSAAGGKCHYCGEWGRMANMEIDHRLPRSRGGTDHRENLCLACPSCNRRKGARTAEEYAASLAASP